MARPARLTAARIVPAADLAAARARWDSTLAMGSPHTRRAYGLDVDDWLQFLAEHGDAPPRLADLADADLTAFRSWLSAQAGRGRGVASRARSLSGVRHFLRWLDREGLAHCAAIALVATPRRRPPLPRPLSIDQALAVPNAALAQARQGWIGLRDQALFAVLYGSGLRIGEALALDDGDWPPRDGTALRVVGKGDKQRAVPVLDIVHDLIDRYRAARPFAGSGPLFVGARGARLNGAVARTAMARIRGALDLPDRATPHALRHSFASHLLAAGVDLRSLQTLLGHSSLTSTQRYLDAGDRAMLDTWRRAHPRGG